MDTKLIIFVIVAVVYLFMVPYAKSVYDETGWKTFCFAIFPIRTVILLIIYLIIF